MSMKGKGRGSFKFVYPKKLPPLIRTEIRNEIGLTEGERLALKHAFIKFQRKARHYASKINTEFLLQNDDYIDYFRTPDGTFQTDIFVAHPRVVLLTIGNIIQNLDNCALVRTLVVDCFTPHKRAGITRSQFIAYGKFIMDFITDELEKQCSPNLLSAAKRLINFMYVVEQRRFTM